MLVGGPMGGKTQIAQTLAQSLEIVAKNEM